MIAMMYGQISRLLPSTSGGRGIGRTMLRGDAKLVEPAFGERCIDGSSIDFRLEVAELAGFEIFSRDFDGGRHATVIPAAQSVIACR